MDPLTLVCEFTLLIWAILVLRKHGWKTEKPGLVWTITVGSLATNVLIYLVLWPKLIAEVANQQIGGVAMYGFLVFRTVMWAVLVHVLTRLALLLGRRNDFPAGFAHLRPKWKSSPVMRRKIS